MVICSQNGKLVIAIDDAHWCDSASLNAIGYLAQRAFFRRNGMLILTTRPDIHSVSLDRFINTYKTSAYLHPIVLQAFGFEEVNELTHFLTGEKPTPELIHQLVKASGGNPLFLIELLRSAMGYLSSETILEKIQKIPISSNMAAIIKERLQNLSQVERNILNIAAIYGESIHPWLLENVSGYSAEEVADALEMLEDEHHLLQLNTQRGDIHYSFVHEKVRETLVQNIYPPRRRLLHRRIAEIILQGGESGYAGSLKIAHHFDQAGLPNQAIPHYLKAAQFAWQMLSQEDCYTQLEHAERLLNMLGEQAAAQEFHAVYALWEKYAVELDDRSTLERISHTMIQKGEHLNSPLLVGAGTSGFALCQAYANQIEQALENIGKAIAFLERTDSIMERMTAYTREAMFFMFTSQYEQAEKAYLQALQTGETAGNPPDCIAINTQTKLELAMLFTVRGKVDQAMELAQKALAESELAFNQTGKLYAIILIALSALFPGQTFPGYSVVPGISTACRGDA